MAETHVLHPSLPIRGAWIEIHTVGFTQTTSAGRSPSGERGLKFGIMLRGAFESRRSPSGERGLKSYLQGGAVAKRSRSPSGERGLKYVKQTATGERKQVAPHPGSVD